jgi:DNA-binding NarL/FixJ family response regulator
MIRIVVADDPPAVRVGPSTLFDSHPDAEVIAEACTGPRNAF